jgi:hypothetical protein
VEERSPSVAGFDLALLRRGEITAVCAALVILIGLFVLPWYVTPHPQLEANAGPGGTVPDEFGAWTGAGTLGALANVVVLLAALGGIAVALAGARGIELDGSGRRLFGLSLTATVAILGRIVFRPDTIGGYRVDTGLRFGIFLTLAGALAMIWAALLRSHRVAPASGLSRPSSRRA